MTPRFPAICEGCRKPFTTPVSMEAGTQPKPICPRCGSPGQILMGSYSIMADDSIIYRTVDETISGKPPNDQELAQLVALLREARNNPQIDRHTIHDAICKVPELRSFADVIPETRVEFYAFVMMILAIIDSIRKGKGARGRRTKPRASKRKPRKTRKQLRGK